MDTQKADMKLLAPQTQDPNELIRFECRHCGDWVLSSKIESHMRQYHNMTTFVVDSSMNNFPT